MSLASAATVAMTNHSFEDPGTGKTSDLATVTGWDATGTGALGVEPVGSAGSYAPAATDGTYYLYAGDDAWATQTTGHVIAAGETFTLTVDMSSTWNSTQGTIQLYYDDGGTFTPVAATVQAFSGSTAGPSSVILSFAADDVAASYGKNIGVKLGTIDGWTGFDNVRLDVVPEPSSTALLGLGGLALILRRKK